MHVCGKMAEWEQVKQALPWFRVGSPYNFGGSGSDVITTLYHKVGSHIQETRVMSQSYVLSSGNQ